MVTWFGDVDVEDPRCHMVHGKHVGDDGEVVEGWFFVPGCLHAALGDGPEDCLCDTLEQQLEEAKATISQLRAELESLGDHTCDLDDEVRELRAWMRKLDPERRQRIMRARYRRRVW